MKNARGKVYYGLHFYPGVAEYREGDSSYRVFLNEDTLRLMDPTFAARPVYVYHVDEVEQDVNKLRNEADGWVIESFFNPADGKHWVKFLAITDRANEAISQGWRLSNCYMPRTFGPKGIWNGVSYQKQIMTGEYEHLAIVPDPRYEESVILNPDEFKAYNEGKQAELKKLANNKEQKPMKLSFFKRAKVENSMDLESMSVTLSSGRTVELMKLINDADAADAAGKDQMANGDHCVDVDGVKMKVNELVDKYKSACGAIHAMTDSAADAEGGDAESVDPAAENAEGDEGAPEPKDEGKDSALVLEKEKEAEEKAAVQNALNEKKIADKALADRLKNANKAKSLSFDVSLPQDQVKRGQALFGS
jgi:hypothetical protein